MFGKRIFLWNLPAVGGITRLIELLREGGFQGVDVKITDGILPFKSGKRDNITPEEVKLLQDSGFDVCGWSFFYGNRIDQEIATAIEAIGKLNLRSHLSDVEGAFESQRNVLTNSRRVAREIKKAHPGILEGFCTFACYTNPRTGKPWHNREMYRIWMEEADFGVPMIYWDGSSVESALWWLTNSVAQWEAVTTKPIIPAGRAYVGDGGIPTPIAVQAFGEAVFRKHPGITWWSLEHAIKQPKAWEVLKKQPGWAQTQPHRPQLEKILSDLRGYSAMDSFPAWARNIFITAQVQLQNRLNDEEG